MRYRTLVTRWPCVFMAASVWFLAPPGATAQSTADGASLRWSPPTTLPLGALVAVVSGDPRGPGESTFLVSMPNGYRIPPHFHPSYERVEVREGTLLVGMGDKLDRKLTRALAAGDSVTAPGGRAPFLDRKRADRRVRDVHRPLYDHLPPRGGRAAATEFPLWLLEWVLRSSPGSARSASTSGASSASARKASRLLKKA